jgi:tripartite-type tricarboxylate transporter receptor subunit TctC
MSRFTRRLVLAGAAACAAGSGRASAQAAEWPQRAVTVIMPLQAGSASDVALRLFLDHLAEEDAVRFTVENVTGAAGMIGAGRAGAAAPDGYTLAALNNSILTILPNVQTRKLGFEPFGSFAPIAGIATIPTFLAVHKDVPVKTVPEFLAYLKSRDGQVNYGSGGGGSPQHLATEMFMAMTGSRMTQVAYRGATAAATDLAGGHVQAMFVAYSLALPFLPSESIRLIGFGGSERHEAHPDVPTIAEQGVPGFEYASWIALYAPNSTPSPIVQRLRASAARVLARPALKERLSAAGLALWSQSPEQVEAAMREDDQRWKAVVAKAKITI